MKLFAFNIFGVGPCVTSDNLGNYILSVNPDALDSAYDSEGYHFAREFNKYCWENSCQALDLPCYQIPNISLNEPFMDLLIDYRLIKRKLKEGVNAYPLRVGEILFKEYTRNEQAVSVFQYEVLENMHKIIYKRNSPMRKKISVNHSLIKPLSETAKIILPKSRAKRNECVLGYLGSQNLTPLEREFAEKHIHGYNSYKGTKNKES